VTGFCYWHYWFGGKRLLERPFDEVVASGAPDFPFCVAWANQTWSGIWHGAPDRVLIEQTYPGLDDEVRHFEYLLPAFRDDRYIRLAGKPVVFIYKPGELPDPPGFVERWQKMAVDAGLGGLHLVAAQGETDYATHIEDGYDSAVYYKFPFGQDHVSEIRRRLQERRYMRGPKRVPYADLLPKPPTTLRGPVFPCVYPNWDNTPRSGRGGVVISGSTPERFRLHVEQALRRVAVLPEDQQVVVIKSWNEWAEGNYLEPDRATGHERGDALASALARFRGTSSGGEAHRFGEPLPPSGSSSR
jgi:hypothetical protein